MPHQMTIQATDFNKIIKQLQLLEEIFDLSTVEGLSPSQFLLYTSQPDNHNDSPKNRVKTMLLHLAGDFKTEGQDLSDRLSLKTHLLFEEGHYKLLFLKLNAILQQYQPERKISIKEVTDCMTVIDCVLLLERYL